MIRIGVLGHRFIEWGGGLDFLRMICASIAAADESVELHVLIPSRGPIATLRKLDLQLRGLAKRLLGRPVARGHEPSLTDLESLLTDAGATVSMHTIDHGHGALRRAFRRLKLDVLIPSFDRLPFGSDVPWVGYLYDAQHKHLPQFFSAAELAQRDRDFTEMLAHADTVIVNARAVAADLRVYFPSGAAKVIALPFSTAPSPAWLDQVPEPARAKYGISGPYFIVCNQFWKHKDHQTAFEAFAALAAERPGLSLVCTGAVSDHRDPLHFNRLQELLRELGVEERVHILGLIPKLDQIALMRGALALIQPTMFEGGPGGGAVYDAVALGIPCIVSDIPVNLELDEPGVRFFRSRDAGSLHRVMALTQDEVMDRVQPSREELLARGRVRRQKCGQAILAATRQAMAANISDQMPKT